MPSVTRAEAADGAGLNSSASCSEVLPLPRCPTRATLRIRSADVCMPGLLSVSWRSDHTRGVGRDRATRVRRRSRVAVSPGGASAGAARPSCAAARCATRSRRAPRRSRAASGSRSSRARSRASRARAGGRSRRRRGPSARSRRRSSAGSGASGSWIVSSSEIWSPLESETVHSSSSAAIVELEIWISASWNSSIDMPSSFAISSSVGARCSLCSSFAFARSISRARARTRARHPVERAQLVDDRAADARDRVRLELDLAAEVEALDRARSARPARRRSGRPPRRARADPRPCGRRRTSPAASRRRPAARGPVRRRSPCSGARGP